MCRWQIKSSEGITISKEGSFHKLKIHKVTEEFAGKYKFEADGRKTEAVIVVEGEKKIHIPSIATRVVSFSYSGLRFVFYSGQKFPCLLRTANQCLLCNCNALADPPRFDAEELEAFKAPVTVKKGHKATFKLPYIGREPIKVQWYLDGEELSEESNIKLENADGHTRLLLTKLQRKDSGEVKLKLKNEFGTVEATSQLTVLGMYANTLLLGVIVS